jgi:hypothetical protein
MADNHRKRKATQNLSTASAGNTETTEEAKKSAVRLHFQPYLLDKGLEMYEDESEENLCNQYLIGEFAEHLRHKERIGGKSYKGGTSIQILGRVRTSINDRFPKNPIWNDYQSWYSNITTNMSKLNSQHCLLTGDSIEDKPPEISRFMMLRIMRTFFFLMMLFPSKVAMYALRGVMMLMNFLAIGRTAESSRSSMKRTKWLHTYQLLWMNWNETKTGLQKPMTFSCDAEHLELDIFYALGTYIIYCGGTLGVDQNPDKFFFPDLAKKKNVASYLDPWIKDLIDFNAEPWNSGASTGPLMGMYDDICPHTNGKVTGLYTDSVWTSFRVGGAMTCQANPCCTEDDANQRGGWTENGGQKVCNRCSKCMMC